MIRNIHKTEKGTFIALQGSLEIGKQAKLKEELLKQIGPDPAQVILDFKEVDFIDSACLGSLIALARRLREKKGDIVITQLKEEVRSIFQITRLDKVFKIFDSNEEVQ